MVPIKRVLCPVDFFPASERAAEYAVVLARNHNARLTLLHVVSPMISGPYELPIDTVAIMEAMNKGSEIGMKKLAKKAEKAGVQVSCLVRDGFVDEEIKRLSDSEKSDIVVMGTHGRRGFEQWLMGSVTQRILRRLNIPLLTLTATKKIEVGATIRRILIATDFSKGAPDAVAYAFSVAQESQASVTVLHVIDDVSADLDPNYREPLILGVQTQLERLVPQAVRDWCQVSTRVETGVPFTTIVKVLKTGKFDLLVMNTHGKSMLDRALLGSTVERVVQSAECPVLLIPPLLKSARKRPS